MHDAENHSRRQRAIERLRVCGLWEGGSFLLLLGVAMPMKYFGDQPLAVTVVGLVHGVLFLLFCFALARVRSVCEWPPRRLAVVFGAGLLPFGPFVIDRRLRAEQAPASDRSDAPG